MRNPAPRLLLPLALLVAAGCGARDPVIGAWRVDVEKTLAAVKAAPPGRREEFPTPADWRDHLKKRLGGEELRFRARSSDRERYMAGRFDGWVAGRRFHGAWRRDPQTEGRYRLYRWMSGETFLLDGVFEISAGAAAWRGRLFFPREFTIYLNKR